MPQPRRLALAAAGLVLVAAASAACASSHQSDTAGTTGGASAAASGTGTHLTSWATTDGPTSDIVLSGAMGDHGTATRDAAGTRLRLALSRGDFELDVANLEDKLKASLARLPVDQQSCSAEASASGTSAVVPGAGTGDYATLSGTFDLTMTLDEVFHPGACHETDPYASQVIILTGWGTLARS
jgi:hypothetical protein